MSVLIAIPVYNESRDLVVVLETLRQQGREVLVVDDGSTDATPSIIASRHDVQSIRHPRNLGYGASLIDAFGYANRRGFQWVITMDADGQHEAESIPRFLEAIASDRWDVVSGSRYLMDHTGDNAPADRVAINRTMTDLINGTFGWSITDAFCGFKAHRVSAMMPLRLTEAGYAFPLQFWPRVWEHKLRLTEIDVRRIYNDPNRRFGGSLDDPKQRLRHYRAIFEGELARIRRDRRDPELRDLPVVPAHTCNVSACCCP
jgi:dolichol-phosphate mannosyltransferase